MINNEFEQHTLGEICDSESGAVDGPFGSNLPASCYIETGIPVIRGSNLSLGMGGFNQDSFVYVSSDTFNKLSRSECLPGDIIFTKKGTLGQTGIIPQDSPHTRYLLSSNQMRLRVDKKKADSQFVYYYVSSQRSVEKIKRDSEYTGVPKINLGYLRDFPILLPRLNRQKAIAHILGTLDDKIELNRQMNETLEGIAQALFKSWFVDFDPVIDNALAAGNEIPDALKARAEVRKGMECDRNALPEAIQQQFPSLLEHNEEMGWIPKGWHVDNISKLCSKIQNGGTPKRSNAEYWDSGTIPWLSSGEVRQTIVTTTENKITDLGLEKSSAKWLPEGSTVVAMYGATAGQVAYVASSLTTNQAVCGLVPKQSFRYFNYLTLERAVSELAHKARGSAQQNISKGIIENTRTIIPSTEIATALQTECSVIFERWIKNMTEEQSLSNLRDTLLPKLLSGSLRIPDAEKLVAEVL